MVRASVMLQCSRSKPCVSWQRRWGFALPGACFLQCVVKSIAWCAQDMCVSALRLVARGQGEQLTLGAAQMDTCAQAIG
jgi:hypothetical protein